MSMRKSTPRLGKTRESAAFRIFPGRGGIYCGGGRNMDKKGEEYTWELKKDGCVLQISEHFTGEETRAELIWQYLLRRLAQKP